MVFSKRWVGERLADGKLFEVYYSEGSTEMQDESPFEYESEVTFKEVFLVENWLKYMNS